MKNLTTVCLLCVVNICSGSGFATLSENPHSAEEVYIQKYIGIAKFEEFRTGVPACITLAQGMLESRNGKSSLADSTINNHFGIKYGSGWKEGFVYHDDDAPREKFRKYSTVQESFEDHSNILRSRSWYTFLFKIKPANYKAWAYGLSKAGYATDKNYAKRLIHIIEKYHLDQLNLTDDDVFQIICSAIV